MSKNSEVASQKPMQKHVWGNGPSLHGYPLHATLKVGVSSGWKRSFRERHQTFKSSEIDFKSVFFNTCCHLKCRLGVEFVFFEFKQGEFKASSRRNPNFRFSNRLKWCFRNLCKKCLEKIRQVCMDTILPSNPRISVSSNRKRSCRECHQTVKSSDIDSNSVFSKHCGT